MRYYYNCRRCWLIRQIAPAFSLRVASASACQQKPTLLYHDTEITQGKHLLQLIKAVPC